MSTEPPDRTRPRSYGPDLALCLGFLLVAVAVTRGLWPAPGRRELALNAQDQTLYEWFLANDARVLRGHAGLLSDRLNAPDGVNLLANTSVIVLGVLLAPVTLGLGAPVTFALIATVNLALTAAAWHFLYTRTLGAHRVAAALGAGLCAFAPGMVSQTNGHLHMTAQWLVPVMVWLVVRMLRAADTGRTGGPDRRGMVTSALGLAAVVTLQIFIGEEVLFLAAITLLLVAAGYAAVRPELVRRAGTGFGAGLAITAGVALVVLAYPLWFQFAGPHGVRGDPFDARFFSADLAGWVAFSPGSLAGSAGAARLGAGAAEQTTFLGWPLLLLAAGCTIWLARHPLAVVCAAAAVPLAALAAGPELVVNGSRTGIPGPYALLDGLPVVEAALPTRFALPVAPLLATVLVLAVDRALRSERPAVRLLVPGLVAAALLPLYPRPLATAERPALPEFVTTGAWRECVEPGGVLVPVPLPTPQQPWAMRWGAAADAGFALPEGFFIGPYGPGGTGTIGTARRPTAVLLAEVAETGTAARIRGVDRQRALLDLDFWRASCVVLDPAAANTAALRTTLDALFGPSTRIADVQVWKVR